ncbi:MAG: hypothetical protein CMB80_16215 [Flammeovirgaceae bacterium]|nr:hypothetical protein [Flammeovirgaceae bacterium]MBE61909.1 hypothetical protein [Flammeovirgaceae bacterium]MBR10162.1 hypothetical protein [Rickettsiales bacterium]MBR11499.1 hypothetical protein [Rickettsiales bacterium]
MTDLGFVKTYSNEFVDVFTNQSIGIIGCVITSDYVPIRYFIETFKEISILARSNQYTKFIFDKRNLRTFHQPSMEWYFLDWKTEMVEYGLTKHRKLLPELDWFVKAVQIARDPLLKKMPHSVINRLDIRYCDSLDQAIAE